LDGQQHRRFLKSHLPLDALPYFPEVRYLWVVRDTRDVFMSLWNHYSSHTDAAYERFASGDPEGGPLPRCPADPREFWRSWMTRSARRRITRSQAWQKRSGTGPPASSSRAPTAAGATS